MTKKWTGRSASYLWDQADDTKNTLSSPNDTEAGFNGDASYYALERKSKSNEWYNSGYSWRMAHYLSPIAENHFLESTMDGVTVDNSPIYQNPYWGTTHDTPALQ